MMSKEELQQLTDNARGFLKEHAGAAAFRAMRARDPAEGFDRALWSKIAELGWAGIAVPEAAGGYDMGPEAIVRIADALGAHLASVPFATTAVFAARVLAGGRAGAERVAPILAGEALAVVALDEGPRHRGLDGIETVVVPDGDGYAVTGLKSNVVDFVAADRALVVGRRADAGGALTVVSVPTGAPGVSATTTVQLDVRRRSKVRFEGVRVAREAVLRDDEGIEPVLAEALEGARLAVAAEMLGAAKAAFALTLDYMRDRRQFGVPIGRFQALQHRAAHIHTELTIAGAALDKAAAAPLDPAAVAVAKSKAGQVAVDTVNEAIQLHGGVGMTDEFDVGLYVKRVRTLENLYGDRRYHADRFAKYRGF